MSTALAEPKQKVPQSDKSIGPTDAAISGSSANASNGNGAGTTQIVGFRIGNEEYGVDIMRVQEIILLGHITKMPEVPDYIRGLINLRGHVIPIVDLRTRFGLPRGQSDEHTRIIVVNVGDKTMGIVVDAVNEVLRIGAEQLEPAPSSIAGIDHAYIKGLIKFESKLLILLDIHAILTREDDAQIDKAAGKAGQ
ncbi:MAG: chemotaxis protein CheW [Phycisphaerae bacterium]|nr:chemotaxis protein CheW [Phycisphaerae bacterium]